MAKLTLNIIHEDGVTVIHKPQRTWIAVGFSRIAIQAARNRPEFNRRGIYLLCGYDADTEREKIYIGKGSVVGARLNSHNSTKAFWNRCIFFGDGDADFIGEGHIAYLESQLIARAYAGTFVVMNEAVPKIRVPEHEREAMREYLEYILDLLPVLGLYGFDHQIESAQEIDAAPNSPVLKNIGDSRQSLDTRPPYIARAGTEAAKIEAAITSTPKSVDKLAEETGLHPLRIRSHINHPRPAPFIDKNDSGEFFRKRPSP